MHDPFGSVRNIAALANERSRAVPMSHKQPTELLHRATIDFVRKIASADEARVQNTQQPQDDPSRNMLLTDTGCLQLGNTHPVHTTHRQRLPAQDEAKVLGHEPLDHRLEPDIDPIGRWREYQSAVNEASDDLVESLHEVTVNLLRHLGSKEKAIKSVVDEYRHNGKRIATSLTRKQQQEQSLLRTAFREHVTSYEQDFRALSEGSPMKRDGRTRRHVKYAEWQKEVQQARVHLRKAAVGGENM
ncbi:hypothetical protein Micbo1qcDRAFT_204675 [Microdochium bolleyi]|uniref:Uncharacterized protein n=1 Tax=Microdochium bolleyi TaxID=196109 RepID=A0A136J2Q1_9PEZI|nr:hypothetical protein Micbo1qcDRAFT_204675 [Microdochium bolleyi]